MRSWFFYLVLGLFPALAEAGPWAREKGKSFLSFSVTATTPTGDIGTTPEFFGAFYMERGLGRDLTLGFDTGINQEMDTTSIMFLRRPVGGTNGANRFALQLGAGTTVSSEGVDYLGQAGASWGRGLETRFGAGWAVLDLSAQYRITAQELVSKADLTFGVKPNERTKIMMQLQTGKYPDSDLFVRLVPSVARKIGERTQVELGAQIGLSGDDRVGIKLGTWLEF